MDRADRTDADLSRWGEPRELAGALLLPASPASAFVTGATLAVDDGYLAH